MRRFWLWVSLGLPVGALAADPPGPAPPASAAVPALRTRDQIIAALPQQHAAVQARLTKLAALSSQWIDKEAQGPQLGPLVRKHEQAVASLVRLWAHLAPADGLWPEALAAGSLEAPLAELSATFADLFTPLRKLAAVDAPLMIRVQAAATSAAQAVDQFDELVDEWDGQRGNSRHAFLPSRPGTGPAPPARPAGAAAPAALRGPSAATSPADQTSAPPAAAASGPAPPPSPALPRRLLPDDELVDLEVADRLEDAPSTTEAEQVWIELEFSEEESPADPPNEPAEAGAADAAELP